MDSPRSFCQSGPRQGADSPSVGRVRGSPDDSPLVHAVTMTIHSGTSVNTRARNISRSKYSQSLQTGHVSCTYALKAAALKDFRRPFDKISLPVSKWLAL
ncbi:hypothetical protein CB1_000345016 [Camelus ferus]|nr:hypothetical protein CB1_000345016 [Camelus ferus]